VSELEAALVRQAAFFLYRQPLRRHARGARRRPLVSDDDLRDFRAWLDAEDFAVHHARRARARRARDDLAEAGYAETARTR
jgi:hypothetical protein